MKGLKLILFLLCMPLLANAEDPEIGKTLFKNYCKSCHNINKNLVGPALRDVHIRRDEDWVIGFIKNSQSYIERGDSTAQALFMQFNQIQMPNQPLSDEQLKDILSYIKVESESKIAKDPIPRPEVAVKAKIEPLHFSDFRFWIMYTITVIIIIGVLNYMVEITSLSKTIQEEK